MKTFLSGKDINSVRTDSVIAARNHCPLRRFYRISAVEEDFTVVLCSDSNVVDNVLALVELLLNRLAVVVGIGVVGGVDSLFLHGA